ncbi:MAG: response regulator [Pseudomonadota bacterium]
MILEGQGLSQKLLIAEDEPVIVESLRFLFEREGYEVDVAVDGRQTLEKLQVMAPDVLVLDAMMRHINGFDVLKTLRANGAGPQPKVLMLTAKGQEKDRQLALELGADAYIAKPYANKEVLETVRRLLES